MRWSGVAICILVLISLIVTGNAQQANYAGAAKIVLQITGMGFDNGSKYFHTQALYSKDPAIKVGQNYDLDIFQFMDGYWGISHMAPVELMSGTIIGIDDYSLDNKTITVTTSANPKDDVAWNNAWKQKIKILNGNSDSSILQANSGSLFSTSPGMFTSMPFIGMGSLFTSPVFIDNPIAGNDAETNDIQRVGNIQLTNGYNGLQLKPSLNLLPSGTLIGSGLPASQLPQRTLLNSYKGPFGS